MDVYNAALQRGMNNLLHAFNEENDVADILPQEESAVNKKTLAGEAVLCGVLDEERIAQAETLSLVDSNFDDSVAEYIVTEVLPRVRMLRVVEIAATRFSPSGLVNLLRVLRQSPSDALEELSLYDVHLHREECAAIQQLLVKHRSHLKRLQLRRCHMDDVAAQAVVEGVAQTTCLADVGLTNNDVVSALAIPLTESDMLFLPASLKVLDISGNHINPAHNRGLSLSMSRCAATLEELYMAKCCVTEATLNALLRVGFHSSHALRVLNVSSGSLLSSAGRVLCSFLTECPNLERLYVQDNLIEADGAACMAVGIPCAKKLTVLGMGGCHLGSLGTRIIVEALRSCAALRELDVSNNKVHDEDVHFMCERGDGVSLQLKFLDLSENPLTQKCCSSLQAFIERRKDARCVVLVRGTAIGDDLSYL